jgi:hypothetical protein
MLECHSLQVRSFAFEGSEKIKRLMTPGWSDDPSKWESIALLSTTKTRDGIDVVTTMRGAQRGGSREYANEFRVLVFTDDQVMISAVYEIGVTTFNFFKLPSPPYTYTWGINTWGLMMTGSWAPYDGSEAHSVMVVSQDCH